LCLAWTAPLGAGAGAVARRLCRCACRVRSGPCCSLRHLDLSCNGIDAAGAEALAAHLDGFWALQRLDLRHNGLRSHPSALSALLRGLARTSCELLT
jgi:hypothetical protein